MNALSIVRRPLSWVILLAAPGLLLSAPPPELTVLRQQYEKSVADRVTAAHEATVAELNGKYCAGLDRAIGQAKQAGKLEEILALEAEKKRIEDKLPLPASEDESDPAAMRKMRPIYREQLAGLEARRNQARAELMEPYLARLRDLEATLVKNDRVEEAKEVLAYRQGLGSVVPAPGPTAAAQPTPLPEPPPASSTSTPPVASSGRGDDRKAAEWVLSLGEKQKLVIEGAGLVTKPGDLPKGNFAVREIAIDGRDLPENQVTVDALQVLAGLDQLRVLRISHLPSLQDGDLAFVSTLSRLEELSLEKLAITEGFLPALRPLRALTKLSFEEIRGITGITFDELAGLRNLSDLTCWKGGLTDEGVAKIATLPHIKLLNMAASKGVTDASLPHLRAMPELEVLVAAATKITPEALGSVAMPKVTTLAFNNLSGRPLRESSPVIAPAFPNVRGIHLSFQIDTQEDLASLAHFRNLQSITNYGGTIKEEAWSGLSELRNLAGFGNYGAAKIPDCAFPVFAQLKKLKALGLGSTPASEAALAAFRKVRPDVKVTQ